VQSTDFPSIVSPLMLAAHRPVKRAKGGKVDGKGKKHLHLIILMPMGGGAPQGALNAAARVPMKGRRPR
jgi:hypothetical protein